MHKPVDAATRRRGEGARGRGGEWAMLAVAIFGAFAGAPLRAQSEAMPHWVPQQSGTKSELRGLMALSDKVAWASGTGGTVLRTVDGGAHWQVIKVPGADSLDFRDLHAVDDKIAWVLSIGPGANSRIYKTRDGGATWTLQFSNPDPKAFYDAFAFWDSEHGIALSDPVDGQFRVITTKNGGRTWEKMPTDSMPAALENEGAFAASGTCLIVADDSIAYFATGGAATARVFRTFDRGNSWRVSDTPLAAGTASAGIFTLAFRDRRRGIALGGDYRKPTEVTQNVGGTNKYGDEWFVGTHKFPNGYRSAVAYVPRTDGRLLVAVGLSGSDLSADLGRSWTPFDNVAYNSVSFADSRASGWAAGPEGRIAKLVW